MASLVLFERNLRVQRGLIEQFSALPELSEIIPAASGAEWLTLFQTAAPF